MKNPFPISLSVAGFDGSGGAGLQADMKTFSARGVYATTVLTSLPIQNTTGVKNVYDLPLDSIGEQMDSIFTDINIDSVKIGMLHKVDIIELVAEKLAFYKPKNIVVDPVMVAKSGHRLLEESAIQALKECILPLANVLTPNLPEAEELLNRKLQFKNPKDYKEGIESAGLEILSIGKNSGSFQTLTESRSVIIKGGHSDFPDSQDCLIQENEPTLWISSPRIESINTHGTGCTFSACISAELAKGRSIAESFRIAKDYLTKAIEAGKDHRIGKGKGPVHFFHEVW